MQINLAPEIANKRRTDAKELLEKYLTHPTTEASSSTHINTLQVQITDLTMKLKVKEMQRVTLSTVFMARKEKNKVEIERLTKALKAYEQEAKPMLGIKSQQYPPQIQMPIREEDTIGEEEPNEGRHTPAYQQPNERRRG